jgi:nucleotide-binding universal stress UspA family protein
MKTILAPTDFSLSSVNAVEYAADLAVSINAKLCLFHAIPFPIAISEVSLPDDFVDDMVEVGYRDLDKLAERLKTRSGERLSVSTEVRIGSVEPELENIAGKIHPAVIVMGYKSGKSIERALLGSSVFHTMNHIEYPTLVIPEDVKFTEIRKLGIACDLSYVDAKFPFDDLILWLRLFKAKVDIINVAKPKDDFTSKQVSQSISIQNRLVAFKPEFHFLTGKNLAGEFNEFIKSHDIDLLIVFPRKHGVFDIFHKKYSRTIVAGQHKPILSIHSS